VLEVIDPSQFVRARQLQFWRLQLFTEPMLQTARVKNKKERPKHFIIIREKAT
jgi:hypothetical protein